MQSPLSLLDNPLNRAGARLLALQGVKVHSGSLPLSQAVAEGLTHWNPRGNRGAQVLSRLAALAEAENPKRFAEAIRPFMSPLAWDPKQAEKEGLPPYSPETLEQYMPQDLAAEAGKCRDLHQLLSILEGQEAKTYEMTT
jgi:hypothetical protein